MNFRDPAAGPSHPEDGEDRDGQAREEWGWVREFQAGDGRGFEQLYRRYARRLASFVRRSGGLDVDASEDAVQEIMMRVHRNLAGFRFESRVSTYLYTAALRWLRDQRVMRRVERRDVPVEELAGRATAQDESEGRELARQVQGLLGQLAPDERNVWLLHETEERSWDEIAALLECSARNAQLQKEKASRFLRERLALLGYGEEKTGGGS